MTRINALWVLMGLVGCADTEASAPTGVLRADRGDVGAVRGTVLTCTKEVATAPTPCDDFGAPRTGTAVSHPASGVVSIELSGSANYTIEGRMVAWIDLSLDSGGKLHATGQEVWTGESVVPRAPELALDGEVIAQDLPSDLDSDGRNAGTFSLTFGWGTLTGSYDSSDPANPPRPR